MNVEKFFRHVKNNIDFNQFAKKVYEVTNQKLNVKYPHESEIDLFDTPESTILLLGRSASERLINRTFDSTENERVKHWNMALKAYALCLPNVEKANDIIKEISIHAQYESKDIFLSDEDF